MIRIIVEVTPPEDDRPGTYRTFDVVNKEMQDFFSANGLKTIIGHEIKPDPVVPAKKEEPKPDPDALPKDANDLQKAKHRKAMGLKASGKLPAKLTPTESIFDQLARFEAKLAEENEKERKEKDEKAKEAEKKRAEENKKLREAQEAWDRRKLRNTFLRIPRPEKKAA